MSLQIFVPQDTTALALGAEKVASALIQGAQKLGLDIEITRNGSRGMFWLEPLMEVETETGRIGFGPVNTANVESILSVLNSDSVETKAMEHPLYLGEVSDIEYLSKQQRLTFKRSGIADPTCIDSYQHQEGFSGLAKALTMTGQDIVGELKNSG